MGKLSFYYSLSPEHQEELDRRLDESWYSNYASHQEWLRSIGCEISKTQISIYGARLKEKAEEAEIQRSYEQAYGEKLTPMQLLRYRMSQLECKASAAQLAKAAKSIDRMVKG
jgi:Protein of unknown function (DUF3486)